MREERVDLKRLTGLIVILAAIAASLILGVFAAEDTYKEASPWAVPELDKAAEYGLITDKIKDKMNVAITREEFAEIAVKLYEKYTGIPAPYSDMSVFADTRNLEVYKAYGLKIIKGTDMRRKLFSPQDIATREQVAVMLYRTVRVMNPTADLSAEGVSKFADERDISSWALEAVRFMNKNDFLRGGAGKISPKETCTREMAVLIAARVYEKYSTDNSSQTENSAAAYSGNQVVVNDLEIFKDDFRIREKDGKDYIFITADKFKYAFKWPYVGYYTYPDVEIIYDSITANWRDKDGEVVFQVEMEADNTKAVISGTEADIDVAPFVEAGRLFVPIDILVAAMEMSVEISSKGDILFVQYKDDFAQDILAGTWANGEGDLFADFEDIKNGTALLSSFVTAYRFNTDGTYGLRMASTGGFNDTFIIQNGKYEIRGSTIVFFDIVETLYKGSPFQIIHEDKTVGKYHYGFIGNYIAKEGRIEIGGIWLNRR